MYIDSRLNDNKTDTMAMKKQVITKRQLTDQLLNTKGATIVSMETFTKPNLLKTNNPYWDKENKKWLLTKISKVNGMIGWRYTNSVNNQRVRENKKDDFQAVERRWGQRIQGTPLVEHKGKVYIELKLENRYETVYVDDGGREVDTEFVEQFLPKSKRSSRQGLDKEVVLRDYMLDSIESITMGGEFYKVGH